MARAAILVTAMLATMASSQAMLRGTTAPSDQVVQWSLLAIVVFGCSVNGAVTVLTAVRWFRYDPCVPYPPGTSPPADRQSARESLRYRIGCLTIRRAFRIELGFFLCQLARLVHSVHVIRHGYAVDTVGERLIAAVEREFVTLMLVFLSLADLLDARRQGLMQDALLKG